MQETIADHGTQAEVAILARLLGKEDGVLSTAMARHLLSLSFRDVDKRRMHQLSVLNQADGLSPEQQDEMLAYAKVGTLLSILKSKARKSLRAKGKKPIKS